MLDHDQPDAVDATTPEAADQPDAAPAAKKAAKRSAKKTSAKKTSKQTAASADDTGHGGEPADSAAPKAAAKKTTATRRTRKSTAAPVVGQDSVGQDSGGQDSIDPAAASDESSTPAKRTRKAATSKRAAAKTVPAAQGADQALFAAETGPDEKPKKRATRKSTAAKATASAPEAAAAGASVEIDAAAEPSIPAAPAVAVPLFQAPTVTVTTRSRRATTRKDAEQPESAQGTQGEDSASEASSDSQESSTPTKRTSRSRGGRKPAAAVSAAEDEELDETQPGADGTEDIGDVDEIDDADEAEDGDEGASSDDGQPRRRRRRGGRRRRRSGDGSSDSSGDSSDSDNPTGEAEGDDDADGDDASDPESIDDSEGSSSSRRRRRRRRAGDSDSGTDDDPENTVTRVRSRRSAEDQITAVAGSTRLEAKKQRRREGREAGRRRAPIVSEAEFLARRESVERVMAIRQRKELTQIAVLEDKVLVEHYVARESQTSLIGNVYLGKVQNVLPSMEAAFVDIGKGRNAVLYAGEVNWQALGHKDGQPRKIESVLSSGQTVLVQVTKDPVGHKGARLTSQVSLAGRFLVYVPDGNTSGISRKLPDTERTRLKTLLKEIVPDTAGVIVRTAAEGASEEELTSDVERLKARWEDIERKAKGNAPALLYGEPDLTLKVVRDLFTEDFTKLIIDGDDAWDTVQGYVSHVAPDLEPRLERFEVGQDGKDVFGRLRIEEQINKGLDRKVWLPSGGSLIIDRTEAMTVVDVNTGKFTGSGGNLEETVTKNNLEAAEEIVRQLRLRDIGGIIVIDFIDMVLESNRDLVVRRLVECLGRDRTRHQVAEVTSLGLVQMTRKRIGTGLLESFSTDCQACAGRGVVVHSAPVEPRQGGGNGGDDDSRRSSRRSRSGRRGDNSAENRAQSSSSDNTPTPTPSAPAESGDVAPHDNSQDSPTDQDTPTDAVEAQTDAPAENQRNRSGRNRNRGRGHGAAQAQPEQAAQQTESAPSEPEQPTEPTPSEQPSEPVPDAEPERVEPEQATEPAQAEPEPTEPPAAPTVVTRTRGRSARRPAGPPTTDSNSDAVIVAEPEQSAAVFEEAQPEPEIPAPVVTHVPIKKRGSRSR